MTELKVAAGLEILEGEGRDAHWAPVPAQLVFSTQDPIAMTLSFGNEDAGFVDWVFAFDLFHRVSVGWSTVGSGDVRLSTDPLSPREHVLLRLISPNGQALLRIVTADIKKFVQAVKPLLDAQPEEDIVESALERFISAILGGSDKENPVD